jgi:hypothetical protein
MYSVLVAGTAVVPEVEKTHCEYVYLPQCLENTPFPHLPPQCNHNVPGAMSLPVDPLPSMSRLADK